MSENTEYEMVHKQGPCHPRMGAAIGVAAVIGLCWVALLSGFSGSGTIRWFDVQTPSMGQAASVGSVVVTKRQPFRDIAVGDVITVRRSASSSYITHRVVQEDDDGFIRTQGDINPAPDPWLTSARHYVGTVVFVAPGAGWLMRGLPWLLTGWLLLWFATTLIRSAEARWHCRMLGNCLVFSIVALILRPWTRVQSLGFEAGPGDATTANLVATGVLPTRVAPAHGDDSVRLLPGETGLVTSDFPNAAGIHQYIPTVSLFGWWLVAVGFLCLLPLLHIVVVGTPIEDRWASRPHSARDILPTFRPMPSLLQLVRNRLGNRRLTGRVPTAMLGGLLSGAALPLVWLSGPERTSGATNMTITHGNNSAGVGTPHNCRYVWSSHPQTQFAFSMADAPGLAANNGEPEPDIRFTKTGGETNGEYIVTGPAGAAVISGAGHLLSSACNEPFESHVNFTNGYLSSTSPQIPCLTTGRMNEPQAVVPLGQTAIFSADMWFRSPSNPTFAGSPLLALSTNNDSWGTTELIADGANHVDQPLRVALDGSGDLQLSVIHKNAEHPWDDALRRRHVVSNQTYSGPGSLFDNTWHHVTVIHNQPAGYTLVYLDGTEVIRMTSNDTFGDNSHGYWRIGCQYIQRNSQPGDDYSSYYHSDPPSFNFSYPGHLTVSNLGEATYRTFEGKLSYFASFRGYELTPAEVAYRYTSKDIPPP